MQFVADINEGVPSPLWHAANSGNAKVVQMLLNAGANVSLKAPDGTTPFMMALIKKHEDAIMAFREAFEDSEWLAECEAFGVVPNLEQNEADCLKSKSTMDCVRKCQELFNKEQIRPEKDDCESELLSLAQEFPVFNDAVEQNWTDAAFFMHDQIQ